MRGFGGGYVFIRTGDVAGSFNNIHNYYVVNVNKTDCLAHRVVWELFNRKLLRDDKVDHIDGDISNNHIQNLRVADMKINGRNKKMYATNTSGVTGVAYVEREGRYRGKMIEELNAQGAGYTERHGI